MTNKSSLALITLKKFREDVIRDAIQTKTYKSTALEKADIVCSNKMAKKSSLALMNLQKYRERVIGYAIQTKNRKTHKSAAFKASALPVKLIHPSLLPSFTESICG